MKTQENPVTLEKIRKTPSTLQKIMKTEIIQENSAGTSKRSEKLY
jgi:hypothetical protein